MNENRRDFIRNSCCALSMLALATQTRHLRLATAMAQTKSSKTSAAAPSDYKALVCVLMDGGNDGNNTIIPHHTDSSVSNYDNYAAARSAHGLAIARNSLLPVTVPAMDGLTYGFHPMLGPAPEMGGINNGIHELWAQGKLAAVVNVGNLIRPMMRDQYHQIPSWRPYQLFSHSDQVQQQQSSRSDSPSPIGWGGRIADRTNAANNPDGRIPMITSIGGTQLFTLGLNTTPLAITDASTPLNQTMELYGVGDADPISVARTNALAHMRTLDLDSEHIRAASHIMDQAQAASVALKTYEEVSAPFPNSKLGNQLKQVARLIKKRNDLNIKRQIFFVSLGGFDHHQNQLSSFGQTGLLAQVSQAMRAFYDEMVAQNMQNQVTTFTLSDFGRTLNPSGMGASVGTDHGWGNHMFVLGGAVNGGNFYGSKRPDGSGSIFPTLQLGGPDDIDNGPSPRGRWLPTSSVEQYAATLCRWFGLSEADLSVIFPNLINFPTSDLGFMNAG